MTRASRSFVLSLAVLVAATPAQARDDAAFSIPAMALGAALARFAAQAGIDIGASDPGLTRERTRGVAGRMSTAAAIGRLLAGTPYRAIRIADRAYRIARRREDPGRETTARPATAPADAPDQPIVVTAAKRDTPLLRFPGNVTVVRLDRADGVPGRDSGALADVAGQAPTVQGTALGSGRDKLFIRGIADSSFLGPTQSTTSVYFGNVPLAYNGSDPNLRLYDVERVEILEGPQGTLYGAGAIGGVIKVAPRAPDLSAVAAAVTLAATATQGGAPGRDEAAMVNLPLRDGHVGLRLIGYDARDGGYVDDRRRRLRDVNRTETSGGRLALRARSDDGWIVDTGLLLQSIRAPDSQYAQRSVGGLARRSAIAQPFKSRFLFGRLEIAKTFADGLSLVTATGIARHDADDRFDATIAPAIPLAYDTRDRNLLLTQEARLSRTLADGGSWLIGIAYLRDRDVITRDYGRIGAERGAVGVINRTVDKAVFGEATLALSPAVAVTAGARLTNARIASSPSTAGAVGPLVAGRPQTRIDPTVALSWRVLPRLAMFARYQPGFRTGGLAVAPGIGRVANFRSDDIRVGEAGLRLERAGGLGLAASAGVSLAHWRNIQADLVDPRGFPFTANVGTGRIAGIESSVDWVPVARWRLAGGLFLTNSRGRAPASPGPRLRATRLPDTPRIAGNASIAYEHPRRDGAIRLAATARYVGSSYLDPSALLNIRQGRYADLGLDGSWRRRGLGLGLAIDNVANARGNRFALGNPFGVARGDQFTPLRPRNARLSASLDW